MMNSSTTICAELVLKLVVPGGRSVHLTADIGYGADDPYAIEMSFNVGEQEPVRWIFARELLTVGIVRRVGDGDVEVWPGQSLDADEERVVYLSLSSPFGQALFELSVTPIADFLHRSYEMVPAGYEDDHIDIQTELDQLLWST